MHKTTNKPLLNMQIQFLNFRERKRRAGHKVIYSKLKAFVMNCPK